jgi:hypothetical protein
MILPSIGLEPKVVTGLNAGAYFILIPLRVRSILLHRNRHANMQLYNDAGCVFTPAMKLRICERGDVQTC